MKITISKNSVDTYLMELSGDLDLYSANQLKDTMVKVFGNKVEYLIINLKNVDKINSAGIGALIYVSSTLRKLNCPLIVIAPPQGQVSQVLEVTKLKAYFTVAPSLKEALSLTKAKADA